MKLCLLATCLAATVAVAACATSAGTGIPNGNVEPGTTPPGTEVPAQEEEEDVTKQPPHSLGVILLGETHGSGTSTKSIPIVSASFLPDALLTKTCKKTLTDGCEIVQAPKCTKVSGSTTGCNSDELCSFDDSCKAVCKKYATCEIACEEDEVCKLPTSGSSTLGTCVKRESFDAGPLAFGGTTQSITLYPPYAFESEGQGAPFLAGAELKVQAAGATEAGFEKFDEKFTATTFLQTTPSLSKISREKIFGTGAIPIAWAAGTDTILISVTGQGGTATCKVKDSLGKFDIPRSVVKAAQSTTSTTTTTESLSITVARQKREIRKDKHAKGTLQIASVKPDGWLELITRSTETASYQGCSTGQALCDDKCADLDYDRDNCGACGNVCSSTQSCYNGTCSGGSSSGSSGSTGTCSTCRSNAVNGSCYSAYTTCSGDTSCYNIYYCAQSCTTSTCQYNCEQNYPSGYTKWSPLKSCLSSYCSGSCGF
jgi:hypothetical protein